MPPSKVFERFPRSNIPDTFANPQAPQNPFTLHIPIDGSTCVLTSNTQFAWGALPGAQSYTLQISLTSTFAEILYEQPNILIPSVFVSIGRGSMHRVAAR